MLCWHKSPKRGRLKGKCALGPFLSILVIECQHKCLNVNLCSWMDKVQIKSKCMFLSLVHWFCVLIYLSKCGKQKEEEKRSSANSLAVYSQDLALSGAPDCPVCTGQCPVRQTSVEQTSRSRVFLRRLRLKFTGLSGVHRTVR